MLWAPRLHPTGHERERWYSSAARARVSNHRAGLQRQYSRILWVLVKDKRTGSAAVCCAYEEEYSRLVFLDAAITASASAGGTPPADHIAGQQMGQMCGGPNASGLSDHKKYKGTGSAAVQLYTCVPRKKAKYAVLLQVPPRAIRMHI